MSANHFLAIRELNGDNIIACLHDFVRQNHGTQEYYSIQLGNPGDVNWGPSTNEQYLGSYYFNGTRHDIIVCTPSWDSTYQLVCDVYRGEHCSSAMRLRGGFCVSRYLDDNEMETLEQRLAA